MYSNIEKSAFRRGEYVGYAAGCVWRIQRCNSSYGNWYAYPTHGDDANRWFTVPMAAHTLRALSQKLAALA